MSDILRAEANIKGVITESPIVLDDYTIEVEPIENGNRLSITRGGQTKHIDILNGEKGEPGADGRDGVDGINGRDGQDGKDGLPGLNGADGKDGIDGRNGRDGRDGIDGKNGRDTVAVSEYTPTDPDVQIWLKENPQFMSIPTMDDIPDVPINRIALAGQATQPSAGLVDIPSSKYNKYGLVKAYGATPGNTDTNLKGIRINSDGILEIAPAAYATIKQQIDSYQPIVSSTAPTAVREALAGPVTDINPAYTEAEKAAAREREARR